MYSMVRKSCPASSARSYTRQQLGWLTRRAMATSLRKRAKRSGSSVRCGGGRGAVGRVPDADRRVPVTRGEPAAVRTPRDARIEAVVARPRRGATQGQDRLAGEHVPDQDLDAGDGGQTLTVRRESQVLAIVAVRTGEGLLV